MRLLFDSKICLNCGEKYSLENRRVDSLYCSDKCGQNYRRKRHYNRNPEYYKQKRSTENSNVQKRIFTRVKSRAKRLGIPFEIQLSDIVVPVQCPVLGIEIRSLEGGGTNQYNSPSLDRIIPELGYVKGNIRVISNRANLLKSNATVEELEKVLEDLRCACA